MVFILTIDSMNYGNRLQNYALYSVLNDLLDTNVTTVRLRDFSSLRNKYWYSLSKGKALFKSLNDESARRDSIFLSFTHKHIPTIQMTPDELRDSDGVLVIGSDQCWNPGWGLGERADGLQCGVGFSSSRKLSYAASFGISLNDFPASWRGRYGEWLSKINHISVREEEGVRIVKALSGANATWVLDPTMLLESSHWAALERRPKGFRYDKDGFILNYVLGESVAANQINKREKSSKLPVVRIGKTTSNVGPAEFLWLIHNAESVFTDSFHGTVFSLLFHRRVFVYSRKDSLGDMSSRFEVFKLFDMFSERVDAEDSMSLPDMDWEVFESKLARLRAHSIKWLKSALADCGVQCTCRRFDA